MIRSKIAITKSEVTDFNFWQLSSFRRKVYIPCIVGPAWAGSTGPMSLGKPISQPLSRSFPHLSTSLVIYFTCISVKISMLQPVSVASCSSPVNLWAEPGSVLSWSRRWVTGSRNMIFPLLHCLDQLTNPQYFSEVSVAWEHKNCLLTPTWKLYQMQVWSYQ